MKGGPCNVQRVTALFANLSTWIAKLKGTQISQHIQHQLSLIVVKEAGGGGGGGRGRGRGRGG
eukprot:11855361-Heterocapsa_arctica.AAC.1